MGPFILGTRSLQLSRHFLSYSMASFFVLALLDVGQRAMAVGYAIFWVVHGEVVLTADNGWGDRIESFVNTGGKMRRCILLAWR